MRMPTYTIISFITKLLRLVTYVQLFLMTVKGLHSAIRLISKAYFNCKATPINNTDTKAVELV